MALLEGRIIVVSGASRGIGYFAALEMARQGAHVIATARTVGGLEELDDAAKEFGATLTLVPMDVTDYEAIDRLGGEISQRWGKLDGFFGNAALLGDLSPLGHVDTKSFEKVLAVNVTANWRFIRSFDPLFTLSDSARILLMTSGIVGNYRPFIGPYAISKAALDALALSYASECANGTTKVNLYEPGTVRTAMRAKVMPGEDPAILPHPKELAPSIAQLLAGENEVNGGTYYFRSKSFKL